MHVCGRVLRDLNLQLMNRGYVNPALAERIEQHRYVAVSSHFCITSAIAYTVIHGWHC